MSIHIERSALLPYSTQQMFALVNDIMRYPEFLPWCSKIEILAHVDDQVKAKLYIGKGPLTQHFTTINTITPDTSIEMNLVEGPFKHLHGLWTFTPLAHNACKITLVMDFDYKNLIMKTTLAPLFNKATGSMVDIFCKRAQTLYGDNTH